MSQTKRTLSSRAERRASRRAKPKSSEAEASPEAEAAEAETEPEASPEASPETEAEASAEADPDPVAEPAETPTYTIDDLAATTGIPSRTIRFYQSSGVLSRPDKRGRIAYYGPQHIERLELIGKMQDRGLRMRAIKDLVEQIDAGEVALNEWLGLEDQLSSAWIDDAPKVVTRAQLDELLGPRRPGFLAELVRAKLLEAQTEAAWLIPSPGLLHSALELDDAGVTIDVATKATEILQRHLGKAARELAGMFADRAGDGFGKDDSVAGISDAYERLRSVGPESVRLIFAREMEQVLRRMVETGEAARIDKKKRRSKTKR
jgi:DNA-binding transcriptional MerR regulator